MFTRLIAVCIVLVVGGSACIPPVEEEDLTRAYGRNTPMGRIQRAGILRVGVPEVESPWARALDGDAPEGFAVDLGREVADTLGVAAEFRPLSIRDMFDQIDRGDLDIGFPLLPLTEKAARRRAVTDPYFVSHQRLLAPAAVSGTDDLSGREVCLLAGEAMGVPEGLADPPVEVPPDLLIDDAETIVPRTGPGGFPCERELRTLAREGREPAATGMDVNLMVLLQRLEETCRDFGVLCATEERDAASVTITGERVSTAGLGALLEEGSAAWVAFVETVFLRFKRDGGWRSSYEEWISPYLGTAPDPPTLTAEEAAALFPRD